MHKFVKWGLVGLSIPIGSLLLGATWLNLNISQRLAKDYNTTTVHWNHSEAGDLQIGERIVRVRNGCIDCHGNNLAGAKIMDNPAMGKMYGSNLTPASLKDWSDTEIARAIRHGIGRDGKPLVLMPSHDYINFSESDLKAVIAYLRSIPAVTQANGPIALGPVAKVLPTALLKQTRRSPHHRVWQIFGANGLYRLPRPRAERRPHSWRPPRLAGSLQFNPTELRSMEQRGLCHRHAQRHNP
jgi:mono/diheme cytochrome c family protein